MPITYEKEHNLFKLETKSTSYHMQVSEYGHLLHLYYGKKIAGNTEYLLTYQDRGFSGNPAEAKEHRQYSLDALPQEYPTDGSGDYRVSAFNVVDTKGAFHCELRYKSHRVVEGKYELPGLPNVYGNKDEGETLEIVLEDTSGALTVTLLYGVMARHDVITRGAKIENIATDPFRIERAMSACIDVMYGQYDWMCFYGRHAMEQNIQRVPVHHGIQGIGSKRGASSHQYNPFIIMADQETTEDYGDCFGMNFVYSGGHKTEIELDQYNQYRVVMGLQDELFCYELQPGDVFYTPEVMMSYSNEGLSKLSQNFHRIIRDHVCRGYYQHRPRPVLINNWEATYFDFDGDKLLALAKEAADCHIEMIVLDDGWFGKRDSDNSGLGDWFVNEEKLGCSLETLVHRINDLDIKFGLWFEPEMINDASRLYETHPDWVLTIPGKDPVYSRNQRVLDFSKKEVVDYIYDGMCRILDSANIEYIKWDFNRSISDVYSSSHEGRQGQVAYDYMLGLYGLLEALLDRYPKLLIESCSGGGGRFDVGMLYYSPQIWTSDNTDAIARLAIQKGTSYGYPVSAMGAHVSAVPNHQTGRQTPFDTRSVVAMAGSFGYELDLEQLSEEEKNAIRSQIATFHQYWEVIHHGDYYRLRSYEEKVTLEAWQCVAKDKGETLVSVVYKDNEANSPAHYIRLKGLDAFGIYKEVKSGKLYSGSTLMNAGYPLEFPTKEYEAYQYLFKKI